MKKIGLILLANLLIPSFAFAEMCGVLDFGDNEGIVWEYRKGSFFDLDNNKISDAVPAKKKIKPVSKADAAITIESLGSSKSASGKSTFKYAYKLPKSKAFQATKKGSNIVSLFEGSGESLNVLVLNYSTGDVFRASIADFLAKKKLNFVLDENAMFSTYDCKNDGEEG